MDFFFLFDSLFNFNSVDVELPNSVFQIKLDFLFRNNNNILYIFSGKEVEVATPAPAKATKTQSKDTPADSGSDQPK